MASVKLTKTELKKQKDQLKRYQRYLPTLQLKKQQLQLVIRKVEHEIREYRLKQEELHKALLHWVHVYGENLKFSPKMRLEHLVVVDSIKRKKGNIAGVTIRSLKRSPSSGSPTTCMRTRSGSTAGSRH